MAVMKICKSDAHHFVPGFQQSKGHSFKRDKRGPAAQRADPESKPFSYIQRRPVYITNILMYFCIWVRDLCCSNEECDILIFLNQMAVHCVQV